MRSLSNGIRVLALAVMLIAHTLPVFSQTTTGRILGTVRDQTGAGVAGASVVVTDVQHDTKRTLTTDPSGDYAAPELQPGVYKIRAEAKGFKAVERPNIVVEVAQDLRVDMALSPGQISETVVVTDEVPLVNSTSATLGGTLSNAEINDLPLNGRNYENLLQLRPEAVPITDAIGNILREGLLGALFAILVIFLFLRSARATLVAAVSIPLSLIVALLVLWWQGITLNILTLGGLMVAIGRVV